MLFLLAHRPLAFLIALVLGVSLWACSGPEPLPTPVLDAGTDAGAQPDAGAEPDGGELPDAGDPADAGHDAGVADAGEPEDAGVPDAGCTWDAGQPPNLLFNPGFECGDPPEGWTSPGGSLLESEDTVVRSGEQAARLSSPAGGAAMAIQPEDYPAQMVGVDRFCAEAFALGAPGLTERLAIRALRTGAFDETTFNAPMDGTWQRLHVAANTTAFHNQVTVRVVVPNPDAGTALYVDDVALWRSPDGGCAR